jgi:hypothetical protein
MYPFLSFLVSHYPYLSYHLLSFLIVACLLCYLLSFHLSISSCFFSFLSRLILSVFSLSFFSLLQSRGFVGRNEMYRKFQGDCLPGGYDHFNWVIFDEVHALDGEDGDALQRLIRAMSCKFLALSATVGNAQELRGWLERVRGDQLLGKHSFTHTMLHCNALRYTIPLQRPIPFASLSFFYLSTHLSSTSS